MSRKYSDPPFVEHSSTDKSLPDMLRDGDIDAAILGNDLPEGDEFVPVIPDAADRDRWWQQHGFMPINHVVVVSRDASRRDARRRARRLWPAAPRRRPKWPAAGGTQPDDVRLRAAARTAGLDHRGLLDQGLLPRRLTVDEVFGPAADILGRSGP